MDSIWAHGAMSFLKESIMERSDNYEVHIDGKTRFIANERVKNNHNTAVCIPYSMKQLMFEMMGICLKTIFF